MTNLVPAIVSTSLALIPVFIWIDVIHGENENRGLYFKTFLFGTLSVVPVAIFNYFVASQVENQIAAKALTAVTAAVFMGLFVGMVEEIAKNLIVRVVDRRHPEYVQTIGSALKLSICAGLGFSFIENILYFYMVWTNPDSDFSVLFSTVVFRSVFTMCMHMVASGIFGYYFGLGKFSADLTEQAILSGKGFWFSRFISKITGRMLFQTVREMKNLRGLLIAMTLHATFNSSLELQHKLPPIFIVIGGVLFIFYLMKTKSGHLYFSAIKKRSSSMAPHDEDVVMELIGMWTKEGKYEEVMEICDRLLARDPDNNVVRLFRAKAGDNQKFKDLYLSMKALFGKDKTETKGILKTKIDVPDSMSQEQEKIVLEVMENWYDEKKYKDVLEIAKRLLEKNPNSEGAKVMLEKALDKDKMARVFEKLGNLFGE